MTGIIGTWALVRSVTKDSDGRDQPSMFGPKAMGRATFNADGRMMAVLCDGRPELPADAPRDYVSYCGNYQFDGTCLVTRVDATSDAARMGTDQIRAVRFENARMVLAPPPRIAGDLTLHRELYWERISEV
jgi:hypothetical protein